MWSFIGTRETRWFWWTLTKTTSRKPPSSTFINKYIRVPVKRPPRLGPVSYLLQPRSAGYTARTESIHGVLSYVELFHPLLGKLPEKNSRYQALIQRLYGFWNKKRNITILKLIGGSLDILPWFYRPTS